MRRPASRSAGLPRRLGVVVAGLLALGLGACQQVCNLGACIDCESDLWPEPRIGPVCQSLCAPYVPLDEPRACSRVPPSPYTGVPLPTRQAPRPWEDAAAAANPSSVPPLRADAGGPPQR